jgi:NarL family two-component system response regulator LiaR
VKQILLYGVLGGLLIALLQFVEYKHFVHSYPGEMYGGLIAIIFTVVGVYVGLKWTRPKEPFVASGDVLKDLRITPREHEILQLIAEGLTNKEIGERLFVSENTVKTHSYRLFEKMDVKRRVQAVQKARQLGLLP